MTKFLYLLLFFNFFLKIEAVFSQNGFAYLSHHTHEIKGISKAAKAISQDKNGLMYIGNRHGVLLYDGSHWDFVRTVGEVVALTSDGNAVWVSGKNTAGFISQSTKGEMKFQSVIDTTKNNVVYTSIERVGDFAYFLSAQNLIQYNISTKKITQSWDSDSKFDIAAIFTVNGKLYADVTNNGIMRLEGNKFVATGEKLSNEDEVFTAKSYDKIAILATIDNNLFTFDGQKLNKIQIEDADFLSKGEILAIEILSERLAAVGTLKGGCLIFDYQTGKTIQIINENSGLPDNEILAIGKDMNAGIWIGSNKGVSRADYSLPFRNFSYYKGLEGQILSVVEFENTIFVGTTLGLFYLKKIANYEELSRLVSREITKPVLKMQLVTKTEEVVSEDKKTTETSTENDIVQEKRRKKRRSKKNIAAIDVMSDKIDAGKLDIIQTYEPIIENEIVSVSEIQKYMQLKAISYTFQKVKGIDGKCLYLFPFGNQLLAGTHAGLFAVTQKNAKRILDLPVGFLTKQEKTNRIWATTKGNVLVSMVFKNGTWQDENYYSDFYDPINRVVLDANDKVWVCGKDYIYEMIAEKNWQVYDRKAYKVRNLFSDDIVPLRHDGRLFFVITNNVFTFDQTKNQIVADSVMTNIIGKETEIFADNPDFMITHKKRQWRVFGERKINEKNLLFLNVFDQIENLYMTEADGFWFVKNNQLFHFDNKIEKLSNFSYELLLKKIESKEQLLPHGKLNLSFEDNTLAFNFKMPDFLNSKAIEYQYWLEGKMEKWSSWQKDANVIFHELDPGAYTLHVRSRNAFGNEREIEEIKLVINPPYWKTWWFYAASMCLFGSLLLISSRMNQKTAKIQSKIYKFFTRFLTLLTLIMCLEFIKVLLESLINIEGTPIVDFSIEVLLALIIFPFEVLLSYLIFKSKTDTKD